MSLLTKPPESIASLDVGESYHPFPDQLPLVIIRVAIDPDVFIIRNYIHDNNKVDQTKCETLIKYARHSGKLQYARTLCGKESGRYKSYLCWIRTQEEGIDDNEDENGYDVDSSNNETDEIERLLNTDAAIEIATDYTSLGAFLFLHNAGQNQVVCEDLQILKYDKRGRYDLHHDSMSRVCTCLTYLNGIGGTWFPFAKLGSSASIWGDDDNENDDDDGISIQDVQQEGEDLYVIVNNGVDDEPKKLSPGQNGLYIAGKEEYANFQHYTSEDEDEPDNPHVVWIQPGDAIVFYNYKQVQQQQQQHTQKKNSNNMEENWRAQHMGTTCLQEKWIATNWFRLEDDEDEENDDDKDGQIKQKIISPTQVKSLHTGDMTKTL